MLIRGETLKTIAAATGFRDVHYLSHTFSKATGMSPREYARTYFRYDPLDAYHDNAE